jgi:uncharacterized membrane protein YheB (UPF0754 family)
MTATIALFIIGSTGVICWLFFRGLLSFLFSPVKPIIIAGLKIQGILPRFRNQLIQETGEWINTQLMPSLKLEEKLTDPGTLNKLLPVIEEHIDDFLRNKLTQEMPMISMFIGDKTINKLKETFLKEISNLLPKLLLSFAGELQQKMDATVFLHQLSNNYPDHKIKSIFTHSLQKEIQKGTNIALLFGAIAGLIQVIILYWIL